MSKTLREEAEAYGSHSAIFIAGTKAMQRRVVEKCRSETLWRREEDELETRRLAKDAGRNAHILGSLRTEIATLEKIASAIQAIETE